MFSTWLVTYSTGTAEISARDALHAAVVETYELDGICSYDRGLDRVSGLRRTEPEVS